MSRRGVTTAVALADRLARDTSDLGAAARARLGTLADALAWPDDRSPSTDLLGEVVAALAGADRSRVWLMLAVLRAELPTDDAVVATARAIVLDGVVPVLASLLMPGRPPWQRVRTPRTVRVLAGRVLVDVEHTSHTGLATGIQRVAREATARWAAQHDIDLVGWTSDHRALRLLTPAEREVALHGTTGAPSRGSDDEVIVPWGGSYLLPELATERERTRRMLALARWSRSRTAAIGFDCVPLSTAETVGDGMGAGFAGNLAALRQMDRVVAISEAAATEYRGWRRMLAGTGLPGPDVVAVPLPIQAPAVGVDLSPAGDLETGDLPLVLCVGSHEPRKNHVAVLEAAEDVWRSGLEFALVFVGGNAWHAHEFTVRLAELAAAGRAVHAVQAVTDELLAAAYRRARCVVFPSLNEGFGLPVAEALAVGTPVLTSDFGAMRELASHGGALLVDPRDDAALAAALGALVGDDALHARLAAQAAAVPTRTWDEYADAAWRALTG